MTINVPRDYVYLDWAATAPLCDEAAQAMVPFLAPGAGNIALGMNANSLHSPGRAAFEALEIARRDIASCIGASRPSEIVFTSGATEADNAAIIGIAHMQAKLLKQRGAGSKPRVVTTAIEHDAVENPIKRLESEGFDVVRISPDRQGFVSMGDIESALDESTALVSVQFANSEIGSVQPIAEIARIVHEAGALFHTDATQALGKVAVDVGALGVDVASFSAHKIGGPKGVGALYLKARTPFEAQMLGGGQEDGRRSTTQNVCGAVGFAAACAHAVSTLEGESERQARMRDFLYGRLSSMEGVRATVNVKENPGRYLPNIVHVTVNGYESETLVLRLDRAGFGVSGGSACSSHSLEPSKVLRAIGIKADDAYGALRISFGGFIEFEDLERFAKALEDCIR